MTFILHRPVEGWYTEHGREFFGVIGLKEVGAISAPTLERAFKAARSWRDPSPILTLAAPAPDTLQ